MINGQYIANKNNKNIHNSSLDTLDKEIFGRTTIHYDNMQDAAASQQIRDHQITAAEDEKNLK
jgi:hypothetical protein